MSIDNKSFKHLVANAEFHGETKPVYPNLKYFIDDDNIRNLISMRCAKEGENSLKEYNITLKGNQVTSMNRTTAWKNDGVLKKLGVQLNFDVEAKASRESKQSLVFHIEWE